MVMKLVFGCIVSEFELGRQAGGAIELEALMEWEWWYWPSEGLTPDFVGY
jgi:hypothetical protein